MCPVEGDDEEEVVLVGARRVVDICPDMCPAGAVEEELVLGLMLDHVGCPITGSCLRLGMEARKRVSC